MSKPDDILADRIVKVISESGILPEDLLSRYKSKIANGMTSEDWIILSEPKDENDGENDA